MTILGNTVLIKHEAKKKQSVILLADNAEDQDQYDVTLTIIQLGDECSKKFKVGQEILLGKWAEAICPPLTFEKDPKGNVTMEVIFHTDNIAVIK